MHHHPPPHQTKNKSAYIELSLSQAYPVSVLVKTCPVSPSFSGLNTPGDSESGVEYNVSGSLVSSASYSSCDKWIMFSYVSLDDSTQPTV